MGIGDKRTFQVEFSAEGEQNVVTAIRTMVAELKKVEVGAKRAGKSGSELGRSFRNILLRTTAIIGVFRTIDLLQRSLASVVTTGLEYNQTIESATLAIASLITATSDLVDENGELVTGVDALDTAYGLAEKQVQKLRIAGIQTAATTQELVDAFQQAVGAGLATGLTLDEIRVVTIRIAQAAGALGVPYRQLNEEIRSILGGIIDQNTRIAKSLGITNEQIKAAKEQGRLAEFLLESFEAFGIAGDRIVNTFAALKSNVAETAELLAGMATKPLFEALRDRGGEALKGIFDFETAEISDQFSGLLDGLQLIFAEVGDLLGDAIELGLAAMEEMSEKLDEVKEGVLGVADSVSRLVRSTGALIANLAKMAHSSALMSQSIETVADAIELIRDSKILTLGVGLGIAAVAAQILVAVVGVAAAKFLLLAGVVFGVVAAVDALWTSENELIRQKTALINIQRQESAEYNDAAIRATELAKAYDIQAKAMKDLAEDSEEMAIAQALLKSIEGELIALGPEYAKAIEDGGGAHELTTALIRAEVDARRDLLVAQIANLEADLAANRAAVRGPPPRRGPLGLNAIRSFLDRFKPAQFRALEDQGDDLTAALEEARAALERLDEVIAATDVTLRGKAGDDDGTKALKALRADVTLRLAEIKAALSLEETELKASLERQEISYNEYFDRLKAARVEAIDAQIFQQRRLAAAETDANKRATVQAKIIQLEAQRITEQTKLELAREKQLESLADARQKAEIRLFEATGRGAEAARIKVESEFEDLIAHLKLMGDQEGLDIIKQLIDVEKVKAEFKELQAIAQRGQQQLRDTLQRIQLEEQTGVIGSEEARRAQAQAYRDLRADLKPIIADLRLLAETAQDPKTALEAQKLVDLYGQLALQIRGLTDDWLRFKKEFRAAAEDTLANHLADAVTEAENLGQALANLTNVRSLLGAIATEIVQITARMIALRIVTAAFGAFSGGGAVGGASSLPQGNYYASGGKVTGPGGPTSDQVFARLSAGEYVVRAASVRKYGVDFFHAVNRGALPRAVTRLERFASGGLVRSSALQQRSELAGDAVKGELTVGLTEGLVVDQLDSPAGDRLVLKVINRNRRGIRNALGF